MHIGVLRIQLHLPNSHSLKGKRQIIKSLTIQIRNRFNVSVAEIDDRDSWQSATIGITTAGTDKAHTNEVLSRVINFISNGYFDAVMLSYEIELLNC